MLREWHLSPEYILDSWTDEQFESFWDARNENILNLDRAVNAISESPNYSPPAPSKRVSDRELFQMMGIKPAKA